ncbi:hypothetical protein QBC38DRAFT_485965 [Podospora fimiseda]|uniref:Uncharacterized protein n=1 Tax=Podospora fimiseda TaxID=252190 RepID=A0AAN7BJ35_9PEZI|nr:hypothetical protein QBC38DRAFT_485965 [Podospora fimiseda]
MVVVVSGDRIHWVGCRQREPCDRLHKRRLDRYSDVVHRNIPLRIPQGFWVVEDAFVTIPEALISRETLTYVGISTSKGDEVWRQWIHWPADGPRREIDRDDGGFEGRVSLYDFIIDCVAGDDKPDTIGESKTEWLQCLDTCGTAPDTEAAIMDPDLTMLRNGGSCLYWVRDRIKMRYEELQEIQRTSRRRDMELRREEPNLIVSVTGLAPFNEGGFNPNFEPR